MVGQDLWDFIGCYVDAVQVIPYEMQKNVTGYLQSDLQHRHLLNMLLRCANHLRSVQSSEDRLRILKEMIVFLLGIEDICNRRIQALDELDELIESHSQKLVNSRAKVSASTSENLPEDETDTSDNEVYDSRQDDKLSLVRHNAMQDLGLDKPDSSSNARLNSVNVRGRERITLRSIAVPRRGLSRWNPLAHRRKSANSSTNCQNPNTTFSHRGSSDARSSGRTVLDQRQHKLCVTFSRYSRAQHHRLKNHRSLSKPIHSSRSRSVPRCELTMATHSLNKKPTTSRYSSEFRLSCKGSRSSTGVKRLAGRQDRVQSSYYLSKKRYSSSYKLISNLASDEESGKHDPFSLAAIGNPRKTDCNSPWNKPFSSNNDSESDNSGDRKSSSAVAESTHTYDCKPNYSNDQAVRSVMFADVSLNSPQITDGSRQRIYRLRKQIPGTNQKDSSHREHSPLADEHPTRTSLGNCSYQNTQIMRRAGRGSARVRLETQLITRSSPDSNSKQTDDSITDKPRGLIPSHSPSMGRSISGQTSDASGSPDERLYCLCKKVSFGDMIACDNKFCEVEWFHFACVDVRGQPKGKWYCPFCRGESSKTKRSDL